MRTVYPPPPTPAPAVSAASTPARRCAPSRTIARTRAGSVRLILSYSAVSDTGSVAPAALTAAWIDGRNPNVTEASKSTTVENSSDRTYCRSACWANSASSHGAASARRSVRCVITVSGLRLTNRSTTASHPIRHLPTPRQRYLAGRHLDRGGSKAPAEVTATPTGRGTAGRGSSVRACEGGGESRETDAAARYGLPLGVHQVHGVAVGISVQVR